MCNCPGSLELYEICKLVEAQNGNLTSTHKRTSRLYFLTVDADVFERYKLWKTKKAEDILLGDSND